MIELERKVVKEMTVEVICALITVGGVIFSALISYAISRTTANKELEKIKLTWEREDVISSDDEFAEMAGAVAKFIQSNSSTNQRNAMEHVASIRSKETGALGRLLDELYLDIQSGDKYNSDVRLSQVIDQKREAKSKNNASTRNKPKK